VRGSGSWPSMCAAGRDMAARAHLRPVSGCDSCVRCCGPEKVPNSAAAARSGQSGMCNRGEDASSIEKSEKLREKVSSEHANIGWRVVKISTIETEGRGFPTEPSECSLLTSPARAPLSGKLPPRKGREQHFYRNHRTSPKSCGKKSALNTQ
jgi:hypothetical protein